VGIPGRDEKYRHQENRKRACAAGRLLRQTRLDQTREADAIVLEELKASGWYHRIFQHLTINLPYATRQDHCAIVLRPVVSEDVMTARFAHLDIPVLARIVERIAALGFVDAIYYDITNKPPATFGWE
jgi:GMP synthase (glutamine-hydrolysing)